MVQQGVKPRYSARATARRGPGVGGEEAAALAALPAGRATVQAGLRSYALTKAEQQRFARCASEYREARCAGRGRRGGQRRSLQRLCSRHRSWHCNLTDVAHPPSLLSCCRPQEPRAGKVGRRYQPVSL